MYRIIINTWWSN